MKKRKSVLETENMIQTALWLPRDMHERLKKEGGERGLGVEIRRRLQFSFDFEQGPDEWTVSLVGLIRKIAVKISENGEQWSDSRQVSEIFQAAVNKVLSDLISLLAPRTDARPETIANLQKKYGSDANPDSIGPGIARAVLREQATAFLLHK
jgi:hypothetical protein